MRLRQNDEELLATAVAILREFEVLTVTIVGHNETPRVHVMPEAMERIADTVGAIPRVERHGQPDSKYQEASLGFGGCHVFSLHEPHNVPAHWRQQVPQAGEVTADGVCDTQG